MALPLKPLLFLKLVNKTKKFIIERFSLAVLLVTAYSPKVFKKNADSLCPTVLNTSDLFPWNEKPRSPGNSDCFSSFIVLILRVPVWISWIKPKYFVVFRVTIKLRIKLSIIRADIIVLKRRNIEVFELESSFCLVVFLGSVWFAENRHRRPSPLWAIGTPIGRSVTPMSSIPSARSGETLFWVGVSPWMYVATVNASERRSERFFWWFMWLWKKILWKNMSRKSDDSNI